MKDMMKGIGIALLAVAVVVAGQTALSFVVGFRTAQLLGETALSALFLYAVIRAGRKRR
nr:hypothetical protein [uncultured Oscillibacter sp.]